MEEQKEDKSEKHQKLDDDDNRLVKLLIGEYRRKKGVKI